MPLIDLKTDLKSLKYGRDRLGGGSSGQPYIQTNINRPGVNLIGNFDDGLVRGGAVGVGADTFKVLVMPASLTLALYLVVLAIFDPSSPEKEDVY